MKHILQIALVSWLSLTTAWAQVAPSTFDELTLDPNSYWDGTDGTSPGGFSSGDAFFVNQYNPDFGGYWESGFAYSNLSDVTTGEFSNAASAITGSDYSGDGIYGIAEVGYSGAVVKLTGAALNTTVTGFYITNTTYAALVMKNGNSLSKVFGGASGNDQDYFKLTVQGYSSEALKTEKVEFYLADYRNADNSFDYILENWRWVDLRPLGNVDSLLFTLESTDNNEYGMLTPGYFAIDEFNTPLFSSLGGQLGSTAISKTDVSIVNWAQACTVTRGPQDISNGASALASYGTDANAAGPATGTTLVSLGDGGNAVLTFEHSIKNGAGADFAVFENGFSSGNLLFAELAFVEVSSDGVNFFRFPAVSNSSATVQNNSTYTDPQLLYNLAGSAQANYGTPFDLQELDGTVGLDVNNITHVKIVDVVGSINPVYATFDKNGNPVNDPWTTPFASSGFDLDAVAVMHENSVTGVISMHDRPQTISVYPNPAADHINVSFMDQTSEGVLQLLDSRGNELAKETVVAGTDKVSMELSTLKQGVYILLYNGEAQQFIKQ